MTALDHGDDLTPLSDRDELRQEVRRLRGALRQVRNSLAAAYDPDFRPDHAIASLAQVDAVLGGDKP